MKNDIFLYFATLIKHLSDNKELRENGVHGQNFLEDQHCMNLLYFSGINYL